MLSLRFLFAALVSVVLAGAPLAWASVTATPFTQEAFAASQKDGKPILVEITAPWCPVCAKQKPILGELLNEPKFQHVAVYNIDFDSQKDAVRAMGATRQSTLIVFRGATELGRSTGDSNPESIKALVAKTAE